MTDNLMLERMNQFRRNKVRSIVAVGIGGAIIGTALGRLTSPEAARLLVWAVIGLVAGALIELGFQVLCRSLQTGFLHSHERWLRRYGLACLWLWSIPIYIAGGFDAQHWASAWFEQARPYPVNGVLANVVLSGIAVLFLYLVIRPWAFRSSPSRLVLLLMIFLVGFFFVMNVMADPLSFEKAQMQWLFSVIVVLLIMLILTLRMRRWR